MENLVVSESQATPENQQPTSEPTVETGSEVKVSASSEAETPQPPEVTAEKELPKTAETLQVKVQKELQVAWRFTKEKVFPAILKGITFVVEKLDPPMAKLGEKIADTVQSNPNWQKLINSDGWKKVSTAIAPVFRSLGEVWTKATGNLTLPEPVQNIASKKAALTTILAGLVIISLLKPAPAPTVAKPTVKPPVVVTKSIPANVEKAIISTAETYGAGLVQGVEGSSQIGRLVVSLGDMWYQLSPEQQDKLAQSLKETASKLRFADLLLTDSAHHLIARRATVGEGLVIVRR
ncbi:MAG: hypothetical protein ACK4QL_10370 [Pseudanabaenaceae cyanobacterium]